MYCDTPDCPDRSFIAPLQPDLRLAMDCMNNASNSYSSGDTMSSSLANMTISDQHHQENGVLMKGQT